MRLLHQQATEHRVWLDHLSRKYNRPRAELVRELAAPGALEREIAELISQAALAKAHELIASRSWPDQDSPDLFDRAVAGHWRRLRDAEIAQSSGQVAELRALLSDGPVTIATND